MLAQNSNSTDSISSEETTRKRKRSYALDQVSSSKKMDLKCSRCSFSTSSQKKLDKHLAQPECDSKELQCEFCIRRFKDFSTLEHHRNLHLGIKPYKCDHCDSFFGTKSEMNRHIKYKQDFINLKINKSKRTEFSFLIRHTMEKPHKCTFCDYSTVELSKLKRHVRVHTDERPYLCHLCDYASRDTFRLKRHLRTHTGEKPYECPICKNKFSQSNGLKAHIKTFHSEVPTIVDDQGSPIQNAIKSSKKISIKREAKYFSEEKSKLSSFILTKSDGFKHSNTDDFFTCDQCFMRFLTKDLLIEHKVKHTGERPFECEICGMKFSHKFALRAHLLSHDAAYNERLSQTLTTASQMTKNRFLHRKNKFIELIEGSSLKWTDEESRIAFEVKETLDDMVESLCDSLEPSPGIQIVTLSSIPDFEELSEESQILTESPTSQNEFR